MQFFQRRFGDQFARFSPKVQSRRADASFDLLRCRHVRRPGHEELRDNTIPPTMPNSTPKEKSILCARRFRRVEERAESPELDRRFAAKRWDAAAMKLPPRGTARGVLKRNRARWHATGSCASACAGRSIWLANTYTFTKSLGESILARHGRDLPIAIVRHRSWRARSVLPLPAGTKGSIHPVRFPIFSARTSASSLRMNASVST